MIALMRALKPSSVKRRLRQFFVIPVCLPAGRREKIHLCKNYAIFTPIYFSVVSYWLPIAVLYYIYLMPVLLNSKIYDVSVEQQAIRDGFGEGLIEAAEKDERIVVLTADLSDSTRVLGFAKKFPKRFIEVGVAEQNLASVAAGLSAMGKIPFITSFAIFSPGRNWEIIRTAICYNGANVKIVGSHAGFSAGPDGGSHQALEDIALMRVLPNMAVVAPADAVEARKAAIAAAEFDGPVYLRLARDKSPVATASDTPFKIGEAAIWQTSEKPVVLIIACGLMSYRAAQAAKKLASLGIETTVINNHTIKPLDRKTILEEAEKAGSVVVVEEHQRVGGLGGAICELLSTESSMPVELIGVNDCFGQSGSAEELLERYGLGVDDIMSAVLKVLSKKEKHEIFAQKF